MRCPKCDCKESRLLVGLEMRGADDSRSGTALSRELLNLAASKKGEMDGSEIYCSWCGYLVYKDAPEEVDA